MEDILNAVVNDAQPDATPAPEAEVTTEVKQEEQKKTGNPRVDDPWPDSARKAYNRLKDERRKVAYEAQNLRREIEEIRKATQAPANAPNKSSDGPPNEDDFDNYGDYIKAQMRYEMKQELKALQEQSSKSHEMSQEQAWLESRGQYIDKQMAELTQKAPDFKAVEDQYDDVVDEICTVNPLVRRAFLEAENAPLAFYALAKEGALESLANMNYAQATRALAQAEIRGETMLKKPVTGAPSPMAPIKGTGGIDKSIESKSAEEIVKWVRS